MQLKTKAFIMLFITIGLIISAAIANRLGYQSAFKALMYLCLLNFTISAYLATKFIATGNANRYKKLKATSLSLSQSETDNSDEERKKQQFTDTPRDKPKD